MAFEVKCDNCAITATAVGELPRAEGWLAVFDDGDELAFCTWACLDLYADAEVDEAAEPSGGERDGSHQG